MGNTLVTMCEAVVEQEESVRYIVPHGMVAIINLRYHIFQNC